MSLEITEDLIARQSPEAQAIIRVLLAKIAELEARLDKSPQNSSTPPSSQHPHAKPPGNKSRSPRKRGGQPGHHKHERSLIPAEQCEAVEVLKPLQCRRCGESLAGEDSHPLRHQVWELPPIKPIVTEYQRHRLTCECCGISTAAALPTGVPSGQSGPQLVAFVALLMAYFRQSRRRTALFVESILKIPCCAGLTVKHQNIAAAALSDSYDQLQAALRHASAVGMDETAAKESNRKAWLWVAVTSTFTVFAVRLTRAAAVVSELLGESYEGVIGCDRYTGYDAYRRQLCWAHLKRDFQAMIDSGGKSRRIGTRLTDVTNELFRHWHRCRVGTIRRTTMVRNIRGLKYGVWAALEDGMLCGHAATAGTCRHIFDRFDHLWTFLDDEDVEPTNNASERALRHAVIWRKLSFGTQSDAGSRFMETLLTVIETCRQQNRDALQFVTDAVHAQFNHQPAPSLLTNA